jgi:hypothetical protein
MFIATCGAKMVKKLFLKSLNRQGAKYAKGVSFADPVGRIQDQ